MANPCWKKCGISRHPHVATRERFNLEILGKGRGDYCTLLMDSFPNRTIATSAVQVAFVVPVVA